MHTELLSLSKIFTENLFRIPDYQRGYSWTERQLKDFWSDLMLLDDHRDHYTGVLTLENVSTEQVNRWTDDMWIVRSKRFTPYYVVDGQQRLTTSLLLLQAIVEHLGPDDELNYATREDIRRKFLFESKDKGVSRSYIFGYEKDNPSYEFLKTAIFLEPSENHSTNEETIYTRNLAAAKAYFKKQISDFNLEATEAAYTKLTQRFLFNIYTISGDIDVFVAFETMNNRGKALSHLELLKNRLIFLSTRLQADTEERKKLRLIVNESWKTVYHYLGRNGARPLDDDSFLYLHFILYYGHEFEQKDDGAKVYRAWKIQRDDFYKEYLLNHIFSARKSKGDHEKKESPPVVTLEKINGYAQNIKQTVQWYYELFNPSTPRYTEDQVMNLIRLDRLSWNSCQPLIIAGIAATAGQTASPILTELLRALERVLFFNSLQAYLSPRGPVDLIDLAIAVMTKREKPEAVVSKLDNLATQINIAESPLLTGQLTQLNGYYGWRGVRYFLFEYEQWLKGRSKSSRDKLIWNNFASEDYSSDFVTVEHIFPQKAKGAYWEEHFKGYTTAQRKAMRNSVGNLLAISQPKNSSLSNRPFPEKRDGGADRPGYNVGSYSELEVAQLTNWTPNEILKRGYRMLEFFERRWRVALGDAPTKARILGLDFLAPRTSTERSGT